MKINILVFNTNQYITPILKAFEELGTRGYSFYFINSGKRQVEENKKEYFKYKKLLLWPEEVRGLWGKLVFAVSLPALVVFILFALRYYKKKLQIKTLVCFSLLEKILVSPLAHFFGYKTTWIELPGFNYDKLCPLKRRLYRRGAKRARIIALSGFSGEKFREFLPALEPVIIYPGIKPGSCALQDNLFSKLAEVEHKKVNRKFFSLGTVVDLDSEQRVKTFFNAAKNCLNVIPSLQLVIIGDGKKRKSLGWLAKKMGIEEIVWFVGEQKILKKWLDNFDIFICSASKLYLKDINNTLEAASASLPIIGPTGIGLEDIIDNNKNGVIVEPDNSELLSRKIIDLYKDKRLRESLGKEARAKLEKDFGLEGMVLGFEKVL